MDDAISQHKENANRNDLLIWASARGLTADAKELIRLGAEPMTKDKKGFMPVHYAASHGHKELAEFLGSRGADLDVEDPQGRTPLHHAAAGGHLSTVKFLASKLVWLDGYDAQDDAALHLAARGGHLAIVQLLHESGAKINLVNKRGLTPVGEALVGGHVAVAEALLAVGAHADVTARGFSLLHLVCGLGLTASAALLLGPKAKADPNEASNAEALTPLHAAAMAGSLDCVELLLKHGASAAARSAAGLLASELVPVPGASKGADPAAVKHAKQLAQICAKLDAAAGKVAKGAAGNKFAPVASKAAAPVAKTDLPDQATFLQRFAALAKDEQLARVNKYVGMDDASLPSDISPDARAQIQELRKAEHMLTCIKAVSALRHDEDFQQDINNAEVKAAMEVIKKTNDMTKYMNDSRVQGVMAKMQRLQSVLKQNGNPQVGMEDILVAPCGPRSLPETVQKVQSMQAMVKDMQEQAIALLLGRPREQPKAATAAPAAPVLSKGKDTGKADKIAGLAKVPVAKTSAEIEELPNDNAFKPTVSDNFGMRGRPLPTTLRGWLKEFGVEMARQLIQSVVITGATLLLMWYFGMLPSWMKQRPTEAFDVSQAVNAVLSAEEGGFEDAALAYE